MPAERARTSGEPMHEKTPTFAVAAQGPAALIEHHCCNSIALALRE
jgi:hypothetical protein